jgi:PAS domain S-box-containing protein
MFIGFNYLIGCVVVITIMATAAILHFIYYRRFLPLLLKRASEECQAHTPQAPFNSFLDLSDLTKKITSLESDLEFQNKVCEEKYFSLVSVVPHTIYQINSDGYFLWVSDYVEDFGWHPEDLKGRHFSVIIHPDDVDKVSRLAVLPSLYGKNTGGSSAPKLFDERRTGRRSTKDLIIRVIPNGWTVESSLCVKTGRIASFGAVFSVGVYSAPVRSNVKQFVGTVGVIQDMTEYFELKRRLNQYESSLVGSETNG